MGSDCNKKVVLVCRACGWSDKVGLDKTDQKYLKSAVSVYCPRRVCGGRDSEIPAGHVRTMTQCGWWLTIPATAEDLAGVERAKEILSIAQQTYIDNGGQTDDNFNN